MASKRQLPPSGDGAGPSRPSKCPRTSENPAGQTRLELEALLAKKIHELEKLQADIKEIKEKLSNRHATSKPADNGRYEIRIIGAIKERMYTDSYLKAKDGKPLKVEILHNGNKITQGPFASARFEIGVVHGDFWVNDQEGWSDEAFERNLVKARTKVGSILAGNCRSKFSDGEAILSGLKFKDNSNRGEWRLGIRVWGSFNVRILEAISDPFKVLDRRSKATEKPHTPSLTDGVECLKRVGAKRASILKDNNIRKIKDFLELYHKNQTWLLKILGINSVSDESWKAMIEHAKKCDAENNLNNNTKDQMLTAEINADQNVRPDHNTAQHYHSIQDQTVGVQNGQPVDACKSSSVLDSQLLGTEADAVQNTRLDHNKIDHNNLIQAGAQEAQPASVDETFSLDDLLPGTGTNVDQNTRPLECSFGSPHSPPSEAEFLNALYADRAHSVLRGCAAALLLFKRVRRERLIKLLKKLVVRCMLVNKFGKKLLLSHSISARKLVS